MSLYSGYFAAESGLDPSGLWKKVAENQYEAEKDRDSLEDLAILAGGKKEDWACMWPVSYDEEWIPSRLFWKTKTAKCGDVYDTSNLQKNGKVSFMANITIVRDGFGDQAQLVYPTYQRLAVSTLVEEVLKTSGYGATPITTMHIIGHNGCQPGLGRQGFTVKDFLDKNITPNWFDAVRKKGPCRCWFSQDADVRFIGCNSHNHISNNFAKKLLRKGAISYGTNQLIGFGGGGMVWDYGGLVSGINTWGRGPLPTFGADALREVWLTTPGGL